MNDTEKNDCQMNQDKKGMSLRDYFAAKTIQGLLIVHGTSSSMPGAPNPEDVARSSYRIADAMIKQRNRK